MLPFKSSKKMIAELPSVETMDAVDALIYPNLFASLGPADDVIQLRAQQRLHRNVIERSGLLAVRDGMLAVDLVLDNGERQILDFLMPGDIIPLIAHVASKEVAVRAVTVATLFQPVEQAPAASIVKLWERLFEQCQAQLARANIHEMMIGRLDAESRVASFLVHLALRSNGVLGSGIRLALPMSRHDIADHLAINPDTLSRIMTRLETVGLIERISRHEIRIGDIGNLSLLTPLSKMIATVTEVPKHHHALN